MFGLASCLTPFQVGRRVHPFSPAPNCSSPCCAASATVDLANSSPTHCGSASISVSCTNYQALYLHHDAFDSTAYTNLTFWINGGTTGGQVLQLQATTNGSPSGAGFTITALNANTWQLITLPD